MKQLFLLIMPLVEYFIDTPDINIAMIVVVTQDR